MRYSKDWKVQTDVYVYPEHVTSAHAKNIAKYIIRRHHGNVDSFAKYSQGTHVLYSQNLNYNTLTRFYGFTARYLHGDQRREDTPVTTILEELRELATQPVSLDRSLELFHLTWAHSHDVLIVDYCLEHELAESNEFGAICHSKKTSLLYPFVRGKNAEGDELYLPYTGKTVEN